MQGPCSSLVSGASARREGQALAEYAVILGVITLAVVGVFTALAGGIASAMKNVVSVVLAFPRTRWRLHPSFGGGRDRGRFDETSMGVAAQPLSPRVRPRDVLLVGAFVVGWSVGRSRPEPAAARRLSNRRHRSLDAPSFDPCRSARPPALRQPFRLALAGILRAARARAAGLAARPDDARAPLVAPAVAAQQHALAVKQAEAARIGCSAVSSSPASPRAASAPPPRAARRRRRAPSDRSCSRATAPIALATYIAGPGHGDDPPRPRRVERPAPAAGPQRPARAHLSGRPRRRHLRQLDVRVLAIIEYLAQANGEVSVSCLITGHSLYVQAAPASSPPTSTAARSTSALSTAPRSSATRARQRHREGDPPDPRAARVGPAPAGDLADDARRAVVRAARPLQPHPRRLLARPWRSASRPC